MLVAKKSTEETEYTITVSAFGLTESEQEALFDRVAVAAHALEQQVVCFGGPA